MNEYDKKFILIAQGNYIHYKNLYGKIEDETDRVEKENLWAGICTVLNQQYL